MEKEALNFLHSVFGKDAKIINPLMGGMMNRSYVVEDGSQKKYVLYISTPQANDLVDRKIEKENQNIIFNLGITSGNYFFDLETGNKINEYIEGKSLNYETEWDYKKIAELFKKLHGSKTLSSINYQPFTRFITYELAAKACITCFDDKYLSLRNVVFKFKDYLENQPLFLCHNDAQRSNIIKGIDNEYYLIDFEFAANNDPIYDIATFGNNKVQEGRTLLDYYFDGNPSQEQIKRYYLWRIFISLQWYNVATTKHYSGEGKIHGINFLEVSKFFLENALESYKEFKK